MVIFFRRKKKKTSLFTAVSPATKQCPVRVVIWATGKDLPLLSFSPCFKFPLVALVPEDLTPSSEVLGQLHSCVHIHTEAYIHTHS